MGTLTRRRFLVAYGLWVFVLIAYFVPGATWNPVSRFDLTRAIVEHRTLSIDGFERSTGDRAFRDGRWYSDKAPIPSLLAIPAYGAVHAALELTNHHVTFEEIGATDTPVRVRVNGAFRLGLYACSLATAGLAGAALAVILFEVLRKRTSAKGAFACSAVTVLATPIFPYATSFYGHTLAALLLFVAVAIAAEPSPSRARVRIAGACIAAAAGCEYLTAIPGLVVASYLVFGRSWAESRAALLDLAAGAALPVAAVAGYHAVCFGAPWRTGYSNLVQPRFVAGHARGLLGIHTPRFVALAGLLVGPRRGLFYLAPVAAVGVYGLAKGYQADDRTSRIAVATGLTMLLLNAGYYMWWGGAAAGPRHLVPVLPLLGYGLAEAWRSPRVRRALIPLAVLSAAVMFALVAVGIEAPEHGNVLTSYVWPSIAHGRIARIPGASNVGLLLGLSPMATIVPVIGWTTTGFAWLYAKCESLTPS